MRPFSFLLLPSLWAWRHQVSTPAHGDILRAAFFGALGAGVFAALGSGAWWVTSALGSYDELGDFLLRLGLSWLFLACFSFLAFSGIVTSLSSFFLADDLRLLLAAPVAARRLFWARFARTAVHASWMVLALLAPVLAGVGVAVSAPPVYYLTTVAAVVPFALIPVTCGSAVTLALVNIFPARRARDLLMLMGLLFAGAIVVLLRYIRPEQLLRVDSLPDVMAFFATLQSPATPLLPSFWAGEVLFGGLQGRLNLLHILALWSTAMAAAVALCAAFERWHVTGYSRAQEAGKGGVARYALVDRLASLLPIGTSRRALLVKDVKVFLRDVTQWSQLLLLLALALVYLYNFRVLDLDRIPAMGAVVRNAYAFLNLGLAGLVMATVCVRFVFPSVSSEGRAFWTVRTAPVSSADFLWSKYWTGLVPVALLTLGLTLAANELMGVDPFLKALTSTSMLLMSVALVGLATGLGASYPRFDAGSANEVAGSFGGVAFMTVAVSFIILTIALVGWPASVYLFHQSRGRAIPVVSQMLMGACFAGAVAMSLGTWWYSMRAGVAALERMGRT